MPKEQELLVDSRMDDMERNHIKTFDYFGGQSTLGLRWKRWLNAFELFADGKGLIINEENANNKQRRRALLLHLAGPDVQDIFSTLPDTGDAKDYKKAVEALNAYFIPKVDVTYARHSFRQLSQAPGETTRQFATRLRRVAKDCDYGAETDNQIRDEILCKCTNTYMKRKLLEEGSGLTLARALEIAENCEKVDSQLAAMSLDGKGWKRGWKGKQPRDTRKNQANTCCRCGNVGHFGRDPGCPARGQSCHTCGIEGHFHKECRIKRKADGKRGTRTHRNPSKGTANALNLAEVRRRTGVCVCSGY